MISRPYPPEETHAHSQVQGGNAEEFQLSQAYTSLPAQENWTSPPMQEAHDNSLTYHEPLRDCEHSSQWQQQAQQTTRSSPIAIIRSPEVGELTAETDDDDDSVIDVELDAIRLQRKYGAKVIAATYHQTTESMLSKSLLRAPYLGSLSRSENYLSLPPISLSDSYHDSPAEIGSYGSLRDSHQKGRFLDGPASYRDTRTGQLRPLHPRVRYNGVTNSNLSIGERMMRAQKLKEKRQKENKSVDREQNTSSLSAMMDQASKEPESSPDSEVDDALQNVESETPELNEFGEKEQDRFDSSATMMSTSLTAFEYLLSANKLKKPPSSALHSDPGIPEHLVREEQFQPLGRSMSDPTPHLRSPRLTSRTANLPVLTQSCTTEPLATTGWSTYTPSAEAPAVHPTIDTVGTMNGSAQPKQGIAMVSYEYPPQEHNPDTDGAFDMDE